MGGVGSLCATVRLLQGRLLVERVKALGRVPVSTVVVLVT